MKPGAQIVYVPNHADGISHPDTERGFVVSEFGDCHFCRYWRRDNWGILRTRAHSERTPTANLVEHVSGPQMEVDGALRMIQSEFTTPQIAPTRARRV